MHPAPRVRPSRGFTLIELLTVIAIIGILAAILIPVVGKVRATASKARCASNLRQLAQGTVAYANDNLGKLPRRSFTGPGGIFLFPHAFVPADWARFAPYVGNVARDQLLFCPGPLQQWRNTGSPNYAATGTGANYTTYSFYENIPLSPQVVNGYGLGAKNVLQKLEQVPERFTLWTCLTYRASGRFHGHADPDTAAASVQGQNAARADGSVHWVKGENLVVYHYGDGSTNSYGPAAGS